MVGPTMHFAMKAARETRICRRPESPIKDDASRIWLLVGVSSFLIVAAHITGIIIGFALASVL